MAEVVCLMAIRVRSGTFLTRRSSLPLLEDAISCLELGGRSRIVTAMARIKLPPEAWADCPSAVVGCGRVAIPR